MSRHRTIARGWALTAGAWIVMCTSGAALAQQTYTLRLNVSAGQKWSFDMTTNFKQNGQVMTNGQPAQQIDQDANQHRKGTIEILSADDGVPTAERVTFDADCSNSGSLGQGQQVPPFPLAGKTVTLRRGADGTVTTDLPEQPDPQTLQELSRMIEPDKTVYPTHPVSVGETWEPDPAAMAKQFQTGPDDKASMRCKLDSVQTVDGRPVAQITVTGSLSKTEQGFVVTSTTLSGGSKMDVQTGQPLDTDINGRITTKGSKQVPNGNGQMVNIDVSAEGSMRVRQLSSLLNGGGAGVADANGRQMPQPHDNPLAPRPSFAGSFKGNPLSMDLTGDASNFTGTMTLGDKKFPVTAHADGDKLVGTFETDGNKFDFSATMDAGTLTLQSGGATYTLKKAVANPLEQAQPKNPLGQ